MSEKITIINDTEYDHMPDYAEQPNLYGMTLRQALKTLRDVQWGNIGGTGKIELSDGSYMYVELTSTGDGNSSLMNSQRAVRSIYDGCWGEQRVAVYKVA